jgi:hypothetical protein
VEDAEEVTLVGVVVDLRALALRQHVLDVEWVPAEAVCELLSMPQRRCVEVDPGETGAAELSRLDRRCRNRGGGIAPTRATDARQARHRY